MEKIGIDVSPFANIVRSSSTKDLLAGETLLLARTGRVAQYWAPFDHTPASARLAIVGITPGRTQANNALQEFRKALREGAEIDIALRRAKLIASFSGSMRGNIVKLLDSVGLEKALGLPTCASLFDSTRELVHFTSAVRYPVFVNGANYNGTPNLLRTPLLRESIETFLAAEVRRLSNALWLPLGPQPAFALRHLVSLGVLSADRVLEGMPHPSGANNESIAFFLGNKSRDQVSRKRRPEVITLGREKLLAQVSRLGRA